MRAKSQGRELEKVWFLEVSVYGVPEMAPFSIYTSNAYAIVCLDVSMSRNQFECWDLKHAGKETDVIRLWLFASCL